MVIGPPCRSSIKLPANTSASCPGERSNGASATVNLRTSIVFLHAVRRKQPGDPGRDHAGLRVRASMYCNYAAGHHVCGRARNIRDHVGDFTWLRESPSEERLRWTAALAICRVWLGVGRPGRDEKADPNDRSTVVAALLTPSRIFVREPCRGASQGTKRDPINARLCRGSLATPPR